MCKDFWHRRHVSGNFRFIIFIYRKCNKCGQTTRSAVRLEVQTSGYF